MSRSSLSNGSGSSRAIPPEAVARMWKQRAWRIAGLALFFVLPLLPVVGTFIQERAFMFGWALSSAIVGLSMNVLAGYAGQISLAQAVFYGTGAFAVGNLATTQGVPWVISVPLAGLITAMIALVIGFPALRIRGLHLAIATLGFQFVMQRIIFRAQFLTGGAAGIDVHRPTLFGFSTEENANFLWVIMVVLVLVWLIDRNLTRSRGGRAFFAIRQDEQVASSFGIPVSRYKLLAFAISGFYAGIAGAMFGTLQGDVTNELFEYIFSFEFLVFAVLGGLGSRPGTAIGSAFPVIFRQMAEALRFAGTMLGGVLLVFTLIRHPGGMASQGRELGHVAAALRKKHPLLLIPFTVVACVCIAIAIVIGVLASGVMRAVFSATIQAADLGYVAGIMVGLLAFTYIFQALARELVKRTGAWVYMLHEAPAAAAAEEGGSVGGLRIAPATGMSFRRPTIEKSYAGPLLEVENLAIRFGGVKALDGVSMEVRKGELIGIMGPNGSGKTTMLNNISGFLTPNEGDIRFKGRSILGMPPHRRSALGLGRTFQNVGLVKQETVFDNFLIAQHLVCQYGPLEGLVRTGGVLKEERRLRHRARAAIELLRLEDIVDEKVSALPHGRAKLVELGCALVSGPELLLLDEPAAGVSPQEADALGESLKTIAQHFGVTILMIEHHVPLMLQTCDYIYVLNFGRLLTHGAPMEVASHPDVIAAYLGSVGKEASRAVARSH